MLPTIREAEPLAPARLDDLSLALGEIAGQLRGDGPEAEALADVFEIGSARLYAISLRNLNVVGRRRAHTVPRGP